MGDAREAAIGYATAGLAVFPLPTKHKAPTVRWREVATTDAAEVERDWKSESCNIGIACGAASGGLFVIDIDVHGGGVDGMDTLSEWERAHGELPETARVETGSGGMHLYYRSAERVANSANPAAGVDVRGEGGFVLAPPSVHPNGRPYVWEFDTDETGIASADANVMAFLREICGHGGGDGGEWEPFALPDRIGEGARNDTLYRLACSMRSKGYARADAFELLRLRNARNCEPPVGESELRKIFASGFDGHEAGKSPEFVEAHTIDDEGPQLIKRPFQSYANVLTCIRHDPELEGRFFFDSRAYTRMAVCPLPWDGSEGERQITDADYCHLTAYLETGYGLTGKARAADALRAICEETPRNRVAEWLDSLEWDGVPRMDFMLVKWLGATYNDYTVAVTRLLMLGAVARAYEPGVKFDYMPVLVGAQGVGKSEFVRRLGMRDEWTLDNLNTLEGDAAAEKLRGVWIVELAELLATKSARGVESIKAFLTQRVDTFRPKYAAETVQRPRGCVFIGTTNDDAFLTDLTGNRRFLPVSVAMDEPLADLFGDGVEEEFEQAWAEAAHIWETERPSLVMDRAVEARAERERERFQEDDPVAGLVNEYLEQAFGEWLHGGMTGELRVCAAEVAQSLPDEMTRGMSYHAVINRVRDAMRNTTGWRELDGKHRCGKWGSQRCFTHDADVCEPGQ